MAQLLYHPDMSTGVLDQQEAEHVNSQPSTGREEARAIAAQAEEIALPEAAQAEEIALAEAAQAEEIALPEAAQAEEIALPDAAQASLEEAEERSLRSLTTSTKLLKLAEDLSQCNRMEDSEQKDELRVMSMKAEKLELHLHQSRYSKEISRLSTEIETLHSYRTRLNLACATMTNSLQMTEQCLVNRQRYLFAAHDEVQETLTKEVDVMHRTRISLQKIVEELDDQLKQNTRAKGFIEMDQMKLLHDLENFSNFYCHPDDVSARMPARRSAAGWHRFGQTHVKYADRQLEKSKCLRAKVDNMLIETNAQYREHLTATNQAFSRHIFNTRQRVVNSLYKTMDKLREKIVNTLGELNATLAGDLDRLFTEVRFMDMHLGNNPDEQM